MFFPIHKGPSIRVMILNSAARELFLSPGGFSSLAIESGSGVEDARYI